MVAINNDTYENSGKYCKDSFHVPNYAHFYTIARTFGMHATYRYVFD